MATEELTSAQIFNQEWSKEFEKLSIFDQEKFSRALNDIVEVDFPHFNYKFRHSGFKGMAGIFESIYTRNYIANRGSAETPIRKIVSLFHKLWGSNSSGEYDKKVWNEFQFLLQKYLKIGV